MNAVRTVNNQTIVSISPKVHQAVEKKLTKNFGATPWSGSQFMQTVEWLRKYCWELNNIAGTKDFSFCERVPNGNYIWECNNNMGNLIFQLVYNTSNKPIAIIIDEDLSSRIAPFNLVEKKSKKLSDDEYCRILMEEYNAYWHKLFR